MLKYISILFLLISCTNSNSSKRILSASSGNINTISVVVNNQYWEGAVGATIREILAAPVYGLPQDEPMFSMNQIPPQVFSGFTTKNRTVLLVKKSDSTYINFSKNVYAKPQTVIVVSGKNSSEIITLLQKNAAKITAAFKAQELQEKKRRINLSLHNTTDIKDKLGFTINFPSAYRIAKRAPNFFWIRKDITTGTTNLVVYEIPYNRIKKNDSLIRQIIEIRDSIGKAHIPGPIEGSYMVTEKAYAPFASKTTINHKPTIETKGIWDMKNAFMSGPFINYLIEDKANNRYIVIEGFAFAPSVAKRDYVFEMEAIIKSLQTE